ncbi:MAG: ABC transporter permease [Saprospiraceae bacterium]
MFKNYFKLGFRNLLKNRLSSFINISGLALAVGCCLVVFVFLDWFTNQDEFHKKLDRLYVIERITEKDHFISESPAPIGQSLKNEFSQVKNSCRMDYIGSLIKQGDNVFRQNVTFVDSSFYDMFDFPVKWGSKSSFTDQNAIVLSEELSTTLFGKENSIGKNVSIRFNLENNDVVENFTVQGVLEKEPLSASFYFNALLPFEKMATLGLSKNGDWSKSVSITFLELADKKSLIPSVIQSRPYLELYNAANKDSQIKAFHFQPLKGMTFHSYKLNYSRFANTHVIAIIMLLAIAIGILLLVCFNFMNIAIASASGRLKEIGVRKVLGSERKQIIMQFLLENFLICISGVFIGLILAKLFFLPWFARLAKLSLVLDLFGSMRIWVALSALIVFAVLGGAAYPSFYISSLKPVSIVRGKLTLGNKNRFRKVLLGFQFFITFLGIAMALSLMHANKIARARSWGYTPENNVVVTLDKSNSFDLFKSELLNKNRIESVTGSIQLLGAWNKQIVIRNEGKDQTVKSIQVLGGFATHFGMKILQGRDLNSTMLTDQTSSVLVNQAFIKANHWETGLGKSIEYEQKKYTIVGELNDFRFEDFEHHIEPLVMMACDPAAVKYTYVHVDPALVSAAHQVVGDIWKKTFPDQPYDYAYQDNVFDNYFLGFTQVIQILSAASLIMILVSICGIFGLALLILSKKMKDLSIHKILGAGKKVITIQIIKEFALAILVAFILGGPVSWFLINSIFVQVAPESKVSMLPLMATLITMVFMTVFSVAWHLYKAFTNNPIQSLRSE